MWRARPRAGLGCHSTSIAMSRSSTELPEPLQSELRSCETLPSVPAVALQILDLCRQENVALAEIGRVVNRDPALSAKLLKVSNSAFYSVRYEVTSVERAISILGINATLSLALSFSLVRKLHKANGKGFDHASYWRRSVIAAAAAKALAGPADGSGRDELFLAGLLQDIGMLALNEAVPQKYGPLVLAAGGSHQKLVQLEKKAFDVDHAAVGAWLLKRWNLPEKLQVAAAASHDPTAESAPDAGSFCRLTAVAGHIAEIWTDPGAATGVARDAAVNLLGMSPERFETLLGEVAGAISEVTSNLDIDVGGEEMVNRLLDQAREALVVLSMQAQQQVQKIRDLSNQDMLTAVNNRSYLEEVLPQQLDLACRSSKPLSVIFVDIDHFKSVNDTHGHEAGDTVLVSVAGIIRSAVRVSDIVARYGGDEFVCLLPNTDANEAANLGERILNAVRSEPHDFGGAKEIHVTVSLGSATHSPQSPFESGKHLMREADRCLYVAKAEGRNKLVATCLALHRSRDLHLARISHRKRSGKFLIASE